MLLFFYFQFKILLSVPVHVTQGRSLLLWNVRKDYTIRGDNCCSGRSETVNSGEIIAALESLKRKLKTSGEIIATLEWRKRKRKKSGEIIAAIKGRKRKGTVREIIAAIKSRKRKGTVREIIAAIKSRKRKYKKWEKKNCCSRRSEKENVKSGEIIAAIEARKRNENIFF